jgi:DnaK suppressor protein
MYNRGLFRIRQETQMAARKTAKKSPKKAPASRKKTVTKKVSKKKVASRKASKAKGPLKKSTKKKVSSKKASKKKVAKKTSKKKVAKKKVSPERASKKKVAKKTSKKKAATKKVSPKKAYKKKVAKKTSKKKVAKKNVSPKKAAKKTVAKKASKKKVSKPKAAPKTSAVSRKPAAPAKKASRKKAAHRARGDVLTGPIHGINPYTPKRGEDYMSAAQLKHFSDILSAWKRELMFEVDRTVHHMQDEAANFPDPNDRATQESEFGLELRTRDRERKLLRKIDSALSRIEDGSYGYCDETGEEIGLKRLEARPVATLCLEAQERRELAERQFRDRDDRYR